MTFLNASMLFGLAALAIPIVIHLLNRSKPRPIEWGAMQFLLASIASRSRRLKIEDGLLLCLRCLGLTLLALAMARPFLPSLSAIPWVLILPPLLLAVICAGIAVVSRSNESLRRRLLLAAAAALAVAVLGALLEQRIQTRRWLTAGGGDTAIIMDASLSMTLATEGPSPFSRAVEEARALIKASRPGDAFTLILGGPVPQPLVRRPTSDRRELLQALNNSACRPTGGSMATLEALNLAAALLADGPNATKTVVIFTDGHAAGWDSQAEARWQFVAAGFKALPAPPRIICRRLPTPKSFRNALISDIRLARDVVGTDRPVRMDVTLLNGGQSPLQPAAVELIIDGQRVERTPLIKDLLPQAAEVLHFSYGFDTPGYHVIKAQVAVEDDLAADNSLERVVHVVDRLPVLLVEGASTERFFFRKTSSLVRSALTPRTGARPPDSTGPEPSLLITPTLVEASGISALADLSRYRVVLLTDVPRLPAAVADRLTAFVKAGGGLLIAPGGRAEPGFYNAWQAPSGEPVTPAQLKERIYPSDPRHLDIPSFTHPALRLVAQPDQSDARLGLVSAYWKLEVDPTPAPVRIGGRLDSKEPWLAERQLGRGYVLMTPIAFDRRDSNLPSLKCFVPLIHEIVTFLAAPSLVNGNLRPGTEWSVSGTLPAGTPPVPNTAAVTVVMPSGENRPAQIEQRDRQFTVRFSETREPGLFRVRLPAVLASAVGLTTNSAPEALFTVNNQPGESTLTLLSDADFAAIRRHVDLFLPNSLDELLMACSGKVPGQELWKLLILGALLMWVAEVALTRWIAIHRHLHQVDPVRLRSPADSVQATKARLAKLMEAPHHGP
jgi:hypothetical protein